MNKRLSGMAVFLMAVSIMISYPITASAGEAQVLEEDGSSWSQKEELAVFDYPDRGSWLDENVIAPASGGSYSFTVSNDTDFGLHYQLILMDENDIQVPMHYRLKEAGGDYCLGTEDQWVLSQDLEKNVQEKVYLPSGGLRSYCLEWEWPEDSDLEGRTDSGIGLDALDEYPAMYKLYLKIMVEADAEPGNDTHEPESGKEKTDLVIRLKSPQTGDRSFGAALKGGLYALAACLVGMGAWKKYGGEEKKEKSSERGKGEMTAEAVGTSSEREDLTIADKKGRRKMKNRKRKLMLGLLCSILALGGLAAGIYARYTAEIGGSDATRIARFGYEVNDGNDDVEYTADTFQEIDIFNDARSSAAGTVSTANNKSVTYIAPGVYGSFQIELNALKVDVDLDMAGSMVEAVSDRPEALDVAGDGFLSYNITYSAGPSNNASQDIPQKLAWDGYAAKRQSPAQMAEDIENLLAGIKLEKNTIGVITVDWCWVNSEEYDYDDTLLGRKFSRPITSPDGKNDVDYEYSAVAPSLTIYIKNAAVQIIEDSLSKPIYTLGSDKTGGWQQVERNAAQPSAAEGGLKMPSEKDGGKN